MMFLEYRFLLKLFSAGKLHVGRDGKSHSQRWYNQPFCCHNTWSRRPTIECAVKMAGNKSGIWWTSPFFGAGNWENLQKIAEKSKSQKRSHISQELHPRNHFFLSPLQSSLLAPCQKWTVQKMMGILFRKPSVHVGMIPKNRKKKKRGPSSHCPPPTATGFRFSSFFKPTFQTKNPHSSQLVVLNQPIWKTLVKNGNLSPNSYGKFETKKWNHPYIGHPSFLETFTPIFFGPTQLAPFK